MKNILQAYQRLGIESERTKNIVKHVSWSFLYRIGSVIANFILVPLTISYLNSEKYGVWLTLSSFIAWFSIFDIGLGNGLRNKFAEAKALGNNQKAQAMVSTAYYTIGCISVGIFLVFLFLNTYINWNSVFNTSNLLEPELSKLLPIIFSFFALQLVVKLITSIYQADQHHSIQIKIEFFGQLLSLIAIWLITKTTHSSLLLFGTLFSALPVLLLFGLNIFAFRTRFKEFRPRFALWKKEYLKEITGLGFRFFIVQIAALVLFSTDNFIISKLFGPEEVVPYNIAFKYFSIVIMAYTIIITPFWSSFTEAYAKKDYNWIRKSVKSIQRIWLLIPVALVIMIFLSNSFYKFWVGDKIEIPLILSFSMSIFVALITFNMIYSNFINGVGKIQVQLITSIISMVINIPLSILFAKYLGWGTAGVILATCVSLLYSVVLRPVQYFKLINNTAKGIWNK